ncbi:MAG: GldG family protein [Desulfobacteraceae bacterium]|nr:GldG family protein [Desulfobacteraceae bacterium]
MGNFINKENYFKFILYSVIIVLINIVGVTLFFRLDLTASKIYSLSDASQQVVKTLSEPLSIKVFFSMDLPAPHNNTERYLRDLMQEYAARAGKQFNYTFYNVTPEEGTLTSKADENREMASNYGITPVQIRILEDDEVKFKNAYMGLVIIHGDLIEKIPTITSTNGLEYKITTAIQKLNNKVSAFLSLDEKIKITMYLSSSLNTIAPLIGLDNLPKLSGRIKEVIAKLNDKSLGIIEFKHLDLSDKKKLEALNKKHDIMSLSWPAIPDKKINAGIGAAGMIIEFKDQSRTIPLISSVELPIIGTTYQMADPEGLDDELNLIMERMIGINQDIGFLADHGTHMLMPDRMAMMQGRPGGGMRVFNSLVSQRYSIKSISLKKEPIPDGLNSLIIARPTEKFTDYDLFKIDQALMKGTNLALFYDAFNEILPQQGMMGMPPQYKPIDTGLEKLLSHYGIKIKEAYVLDKQCYKHDASQTQGGSREQSIYFAPMLKEKSINTEPGFMKNIKGLVAMQISPVELEPENIKQHKVSATKLLSSSDEAWLMEKTINLNPMMIYPPEAEDEMKAYDLAYILEGSFTSYFKGKKIPQKEMGEKDLKEGDEKETAQAKTLEGVVAKTSLIETSKPAKIFVLACSQVLQDNMLDPEGRTTNATFILNVLDHLNNEDQIALMRSKQQRLNPLEVTTPFKRGLIKAFNIAALPCLVILFGFGVLIRRNAKKKKISKLFSE